MPGRVFVIGNACVDLAIGVPRLPRPGETLVGGPVRRAPGGKGLNQAVMAARSSVAVHFLAPVGDDEPGRMIEAALRTEGLARLALPRPGPPTDCSIIMVAEDAENCIVTSGGCADALDAALAAEFAGSAGPGDVMLLQGNLSQAATIAAAASSRGARIILNTAPLRWPVAPLLPLCWGVVANAVEAQEITGRPPADAAPALRAAGPVFAIVTAGAEGCYTGDGRSHPAPRVQASDTTGAGDAFCGALAAALALGGTPEQAIAAAQRAASDTATRPGAYAALPLQFTP